MKKLKQIRKKTNFTQQDLAEYLNIPKTTYANYEQKENCLPSTDVLIKLADFFKVTIDDLLDHDIPYLINKSEFTEQQLEIIEKIKNLSESSCEKLKAFLIGLEVAEEEKQKIIDLYKN